MGSKIDCKKYHAERIESAAKKIDNYLNSNVNGIRPKFIIAYMGNDPASQVYMKGKINDCKLAGIDCKTLKIDEDISDSGAKALILNQIQAKRDAIILQLPLPNGRKADNIISAITPDTDVDGLVSGSRFKPCTALGVIKLLKANNIQIEGRHVVIVGRSNLVGKPTANLMIDNGATVTVCNSRTPNIGFHTRQADIIVSATGKADLITNNMIKDGVVLIDVGISRDNETGKIKGDISTDCYEKSSYYTTVPGGIGLVTRATLIDNIIDAWEYHNWLVNWR